MTITAAMVKELRETTGAGMMDAKKALVENNGDMEASVDWLRTKGLAKAAKKADRTAAEGVVVLNIAADGKSAVALEINSETDFVARNEQFQAYAYQAAEAAINVADVEALKNVTLSGGKSAQESLTDMIATIGENMNLRRLEKVSVENGVVSAYVHGALATNLGKIGVLVALESTADSVKLQDLGRKIAMHIAAASPESLNIDGVNAENLEREKNIIREQSLTSGKPADIVEKMLAGRIRKYYEEVVLLEQTYVMDGETKIKDVIANASKELGAPVALKAYVRFKMGEGIEKEETDFAAEVAAVVNG
jgi:elongation factor Ts